MIIKFNRSIDLKRLITPLVLSAFLACLSFLPASWLLSNLPFQKLILDSLHTPAGMLLAWILQRLLKSWHAWQRMAVAIMVIITVEILQWYVGRSATMSDVFFGTLGAALLLRPTLLSFIFIISTWLIYFSTQLYIHVDALITFPHISEFKKTSIRQHWHPNNSRLLFINDTHVNMRVVKRNSHYWGAHYKLNHTPQHLQILGMTICAASETDNDVLHIRLDNKANAQWHERLNFEINLHQNLICYHVPIDQDRMKEIQFNPKQLQKISIFMDNQSRSNWFSIQSMELHP